MGPNSFMGGGMWIIFPIIMIPVMLTFMYLMFVRGGRPPWQDSDRGHRDPRPSRESRAHGETEVPESALEILNRRYVNGEITREEFDQMRQVLE